MRLVADCTTAPSVLKPGVVTFDVGSTVSLVETNTAPQQLSLRQE